MKKTITIIFLAFLVAGCVPVLINTFYSPSADGGIPKRYASGGFGGPKSRIEFIRNQVVIKIEASNSKDGIYVYLNFEIPDNKEMRFINGDVQVFNLSNNSKYQGLFEFTPLYTYPSSSWVYRNITDTLIGETTTIDGLFGTTTLGKRFKAKAKIIMPKTDSFKVRLPNMTINKEDIILPDITFKKKKKPEFFVPIN